MANPNSKALKQREFQQSINELPELPELSLSTATGEKRHEQQFNDAAGRKTSVLQLADKT
jgi:hypothetical protein